MKVSRFPPEEKGQGEFQHLAQRFKKHLQITAQHKIQNPKFNKHWVSPRRGPQLPQELICARGAVG